MRVVFLAYFILFLSSCESDCLNFVRVEKVETYTNLTTDINYPVAFSEKHLRKNQAEQIVDKEVLLEIAEKIKHLKIKQSDYKQRGSLLGVADIFTDRNNFTLLYDKQNIWIKQQAYYVDEKLICLLFSKEVI